MSTHSRPRSAYAAGSAPTLVQDRLRQAGNLIFRESGPRADSRRYSLEDGDTLPGRGLTFIENGLGNRVTRSSLKVGAQAGPIPTPSKTAFHYPDEAPLSLKTGSVAQVTPVFSSAATKIQTTPHRVAAF